MPMMILLLWVALGIVLCALYAALLPAYGRSQRSFAARLYRADITDFRAFHLDEMVNCGTDFFEWEGVRRQSRNSNLRK